MTTLLEAVDLLIKEEIIKDRLNEIKTQNTFINLLGTLGGAVAGGYLGTQHDMPLLGTTLGSISGSAVSKLLTMNREIDYINDLICGPYVDEIKKLIRNSTEIINYICEIHRDYSYSSKLMEVAGKYETCILQYNVNEANIKPIRICILNNLKGLLKIIHNYANEKRANKNIINIYEKELIPKFRTIEHYLLNVKVKI